MLIYSVETEQLLRNINMRDYQMMGCQQKTGDKSSTCAADLRSCCGFDIGMRYEKVENWLLRSSLF